MLDVNNFTFLIEFENSWNGSYIVTTENKKSLEILAKAIQDRKKEGTHPFKVFQFDRAKRKFFKVPVQKFITVTDFCTPLNVVLNEIYRR